MHDVIIVGGGPAGSSAACRAAQLGLDVLCIEKAQMPRIKPCGGGLPPAALPYLSEFQDSFNSYAKGAIFIGPKGERVECGEEMQGIMVLRSEFDHTLLHAAVDAGATVIEGETATDIVTQDNHCSVITNSETYDGKIIFGADGINGIVAKRTGLKPKWFPKEVALVMVNESDVGEATIEEIYGVERKTIFHFGYGDTLGYGWIFPKKSHVNVGVGVILARVKNIKDLFGQYVSLNQEQGCLPEIDAANTTAALVPITGPLHRVFASRVFLLGDAAGFVSPGNGEGIQYAIRSGRIAAEVAANIIKENNFRLNQLKQYQTRCMNEFGKNLRLLRMIHSYGFKRISKILNYAQRDNRFATVVFGALQSSNFDRKWEIIRRYVSLWFRDIFGKLPPLSEN